MAKDTISIPDGSTFLVSDLRGDIDVSPLIAHGLARYGFREEAARVAWRRSRRRRSSGTGCLKSSPATGADGRASRSSTRRHPARRRGPPERRYCSCASCSAWSRTATSCSAIPTLPDTIERIELAGIPGRWGRTDAGAVKEVSNVA
jgi:hypothetical protein